MYLQHGRRWQWLPSESRSSTVPSPLHAAAAITVIAVSSSLPRHHHNHCHELFSPCQYYLNIVTDHKEEDVPKGGADGLEDNNKVLSDDLYYFSIPPKININVLFSSSYIICPRPSQLYHFLESRIIFSLSLHQSRYSNITIIVHHCQHRHSSCHHPADDDDITISWPMTPSSSPCRHLAEENFIIVTIVVPSCR